MNLPAQGVPPLGIRVGVGANPVVFPFRRDNPERFCRSSKKLYGFFAAGRTGNFRVASHSYGAGIQTADARERVRTGVTMQGTKSVRIKQRTGAVRGFCKMSIKTFFVRFRILFKC